MTIQLLLLSYEGDALALDLFFRMHSHLFQRIGKENSLTAIFTRPKSYSGYSNDFLVNFSFNLIFDTLDLTRVTDRTVS